MLAPWKENCDEPRQHFQKQGHHFACIVKAMVFPVGMYGCESWTIKKAELWKNWCFQIVVLEKTFESPLDCKTILKEINSEYSLERLMLKLKHQYFDHLMQRGKSQEKTLMLGKLKAGGEEDDRGWDGWMASPTWWTWVWTSSGSWWWTGKPGVLQSMGLQRVKHNWVTELNFQCRGCRFHSWSGS